MLAHSQLFISVSSEEMKQNPALWRDIFPCWLFEEYLASSTGHMNTIDSAEIMTSAAKTSEKNFWTMCNGNFCEKLKAARETGYVYSIQSQAKQK